MGQRVREMKCGHNTSRRGGTKGEDATAGCAGDCYLEVEAEVEVDALAEE
jgi:hypothetical protein